MEMKAKDKLAAARAALPLARDVQAVHANGSASLAELREFLAGLKGKNPQEVIGIVSNSLLLQSVAIATLGTAAILAVFTVGPYLIYGPESEPQAKKAATVAAPPAEEPAAANAVSPAATSATNAGQAPSQPDIQKAAAAMGIDETKAADPKENPLDKPNLDKLLDGIE